MSVIYRPLSGEDLDAVVALLADAMPNEGIGRNVFARKVLLDPNFDPAGAPVAVDGDAIVGFALAIARRVPLEGCVPDGDRGYITLLAVDERRRHQGIGAALVERAEGYLSTQERRLVLVSPYSPGYFTPGVDVEAGAEALRFLTARGYAELYRPLSMSCDPCEAQTPAWVDERERAQTAEGLVIEPYRAERAPAMLEFAAREFPGDWQRVIREAATRIEESADAERLWLAVEQGTVIGFSHYEGERFGPIGIAADQRGRGLGHMLLFRTLGSMSRAGARKAFFLWSNEQTAERLYRSAGFTDARRFAVLRKELPK